MKNQIVRSLSLASILFASACGSAVEPIDDPTLDRLHVNGLHINGLDENGLHINGLDENGLHINGTSASGQELEGLHVEGSQMSAYMASTSEVLTGAELVDAIFEVNAGEPGGDVTYLLRIDDVELDAGAATPDVYLYSMSYRREGDAAWRPICTDGGGDPEPVIPIEGFQWDLTTGRYSEAPGFVTLACRSGAIGSCASWGYRPWIPALVQHHQACIYMKRADYCGDGSSYTVNGTWIDLYDHLSPPIQTPATGWPLEARWGAQGATCVSSRRHPEIPFSGQCLRGGVRVTLPACGELVGGGDLLANRANPRHRPRATP